MKTKGWYRKILLISTLSLFFGGCGLKENDIEFEVFTDAYTIKKRIDGEVKFAVAFYVYGNSGIASATVTPPAGAGTPIELTSSPESSFTFQKEPENEEFKSGLPIVGSYLFEVVADDGTAVQQTDELQILNLGIPGITSAVFQNGNTGLQVKWEIVAGANGYVVKLLDSQYNIIYLSYGISPTATEITVDQGTGSWKSPVYSGDQLILQVQAFVYEPGATEENIIYNIGEISIGETEIVWGF